MKKVIVLTGLVGIIAILLSFMGILPRGWMHPACWDDAHIQGPFQDKDGGWEIRLIATRYPKATPPEDYDYCVRSGDRVTYYKHVKVEPPPEVATKAIAIEPISTLTIAIFGGGILVMAFVLLRGRLVPA